MCTGHLKRQRVRAKNKFTFCRVEAFAWQGAKVQEYRDISSFRNAARQDASALKNVQLFLCEPEVRKKVIKLGCDKT
jgi:hypothetical protein